MDASATPKYPVFDKSNDTVDAHGHSIPDPYRWLEDPDSERTKDFVKKQQAVWNEHLTEFRADSEKFLGRMKELLNYERTSLPGLRDATKTIFFTRNSGLQNHAVLYKQEFGKEPEALLDMNTEYPDGNTSMKATVVSEDGKWLAYGLSHAGSDWFTGYIRNVATKEDTSVRLPWLKFCTFTWLKDSSGFFYARYPTPASFQSDLADREGAGTETHTNTNMCIYFHRLGTDASEDLLVYANTAQPHWFQSIGISDDGKYLILNIVQGTQRSNRVYIARVKDFLEWTKTVQSRTLRHGEIPPAPKDYPYFRFFRLIDNFDAEYSVVYIKEDVLYFHTNLNAPKHRLVAIRVPELLDESKPLAHEHISASRGAGEIEDDKNSPSGPTPEFVEVFPEPQEPGMVLDSATVVAGNKLLLAFTKDAHDVIYVSTVPGAAAIRNAPSGALPRIEPGVELPLPGPGSLEILGTPDRDTVFYRWSSFSAPGTAYRLVFPTPELEEGQKYVRCGEIVLMSEEEAKTIRTLDEGALKGATVSLFHEQKPRGLAPDDFVVTQEFVPTTDGTGRVPIFLVRKKDTALPAPTIVYGYGGFGINMGPGYSQSIVSWIEEGGVWVTTCIRGGGEYGKEWHENGNLLNKLNSFDDLATVIRFLQEKGITTPEMTAINGGSNGGLLTLATPILHRGIIKAVVSAVPVADMLR